MTASPPVAPKRRRPLGWTIAGLLLILWLLLQLLGWWYALRVHRLERRLEELRPAVAAIVLSKQIEESRQACLKAFDQIEQLDLHGENLLALLSQGLPPSITIEKLEVQPLFGLEVRGSFLPGIRSPEETLAPWLRKFQEAGYQVRVRDLSPDRQSAGLWRFALKAQRS